MSIFLQGIVKAKWAQNHYLKDNAEQIREKYYKLRFGDLNDELLRDICSNYYRGIRLNCFSLRFGWRL